MFLISLREAMIELPMRIAVKEMMENSIFKENHVVNQLALATQHILFEALKSLLI